jgi:hypothetical protein
MPMDLKALRSPWELIFLIYEDIDPWLTLIIYPSNSHLLHGDLRGTIRLDEPFNSRGWHGVFPTTPVSPLWNSKLYWMGEMGGYQLNITTYKWPKPSWSKSKRSKSLRRPVIFLTLFFHSHSYSEFSCRGMSFDCLYIWVFFSFRFWPFGCW